MTAIRWARLFGGSIAVMMINDGRGIDEPLDWRNIRSIDDIRVYDRSVIQPDYQSMFSYDPRDPFRTRGSRLGMPEFYHVTSRTGSFTVHDSRCLVFQNGILPENTTNSIYQLWGIPGMCESTGPSVTRKWPTAAQRSCSTAPFRRSTR